MPKLSFDCEELLHWWEPKSDISFIFNFNWCSLQQLREAITIFLSARLYAVAQRAAQAVHETGSPRLKMLMASNPHTPSDLLDYLCEVGSGQVLVRVAENPNTSKDTLAKLAFSHDPEVRAAIADNPSTPESCYKRLVCDESADVRYRIAENPHVPITSLYTLLRDENPYVCQRAKHTLARILTNTILLAGKTLDESGHLPTRPALVFHERIEPINPQLVEELTDICGPEFLPGYPAAEQLL